MYGIFGEGEHDFETLRRIVWKLKGADHRSLPIRGRGFRGCGNLLNSCSRAMTLLYEAGCRRFIVCHDADNQPPDEVRRKVLEGVIKPAGLGPDAVPFVAVPVQMIEAWILADVESADKLFQSWKPGKVKRPPESFDDPKNELVRMSRQGRSRPLYNPTEHNSLMVEHLRLDRVAKRCPSFKRLQDFVLKN